MTAKRRSSRIAFFISQICFKSIGLAIYYWYVTSHTNSGSKYGWIEKPSSGIEFFKKIIDNNLYYVDKTPFIKTIIQEIPNDVILITRPRRFGKTLTIDTAHEFLRLNPTNPNNCENTSHQDCLFKNTSIYRDKDFCRQHMGRYPVIYITLKDIVSADFDSAFLQVTTCICRLANQYLYLLGSDKLTKAHKSVLEKLSDPDYFSSANDNQLDIRNNVRQSLRFLTEILSAHHGTNPILLIDEYDVPLAKAAEHGYYHEMADIIKSMLGEVLKTNPYLTKAILTGCLRVDKESIFTGLNNLYISTVLKDDEGLSEAIGFTEEETYAMLKYYKIERFSDIVTAHYDGYFFGETHMYCPWDIVNFCFENKKYANDLKREIRPSNYWLNTSGNGILNNFLDSLSPGDIDNMQKLMDGEAIVTTIQENLCYGDLLKHNVQDLWALLLYTGYLTFDPFYISENEDEYKIYIPNREIKGCFKKKILDFFTTNKSCNSIAIDLVKNLFDGSRDLIENHITHLLKKYVAIRDLATKSPQENYYHGFLIGVLSAVSGEFATIKSNYQTGLGYADIVLKSHRAAVIMEQKQTGEEKAIKSKIAQDAIDQITAQKYAEEFVDNDDYDSVMGVGVCFYKKDCAVAVKNFK